jgi:hypothetical protein
MFVKGQAHPAGSGRAKGTPNKKTVEWRREEDKRKVESAEMPLDCLLRTMRIMRRPTASPLPAWPQCWQAVAHAGG